MWKWHIKIELFPLQYNSDLHSIFVEVINFDIYQLHDCYYLQIVNGLLNT